MSSTPAGNTAQIAPRTSMLFTSRLRQRAYAGDQKALAYFGGERNFLPSIAMAVNPDSVKFAQPKRITKKALREGAAYMHFTNQRGQNNDILTLTFSGSTGNIDLRGSQGTDGQDTGARFKLLAWHNLYALTREPILLSDGQENVFWIVYNSPLFPIEVTFRGFYHNVLDFEEKGDKPSSARYSFEFTVASSEPPLDEVASRLSQALGSPHAEARWIPNAPISIFGTDLAPSTESPQSGTPAPLALPDTFEAGFA